MKSFPGDEEEGAALVPPPPPRADDDEKLGGGGAGGDHEDDPAAPAVKQQQQQAWWRRRAQKLLPTRSVGLVIAGLVVLGLLLGATSSWWIHLDYASVCKGYLIILHAHLHADESINNHPYRSKT
jgi:protein glucosyltransferase